MTTYRYRGQSLDGAKVTGVIRAYDEFEAVSQLRDRCAFITKIEPVKEKQGNPLTRPVNTRIREKELAMLCSQLSILLSSGLTALRCLQMVAAQTRNKQAPPRAGKGGGGGGRWPLHGGQPRKQPGGALSRHVCGDRPGR